ncbi:unnamed protein product, partial [Polarella glacialis]
ERGSEGAPLRLAGLELVATVNVRNYHVPFSWPFSSWNPLGLETADALECTVSFAVLRDQFTPVQWFYDRTSPVALQHGLRLVVAGTGSIGYYSFSQLIEKLLLGFAAFGCAQTLLDMAWYYLHPKAPVIATKAYQSLQIEEDWGERSGSEEQKKAKSQ